MRFLYDTRSIDEHTQLWWSVRPHLAFPTVEIRICDAQPDLGEAQSLAALCVALTARIARALDEGEPIVEQPHRLIEENMWRAIRYGLSGELIDLERGDVHPGPGAARAAARVGGAGRRRDRRRGVAARARAERGRAPDRAIRREPRPRGDLRRPRRAALACRVTGRAAGRVVRFGAQRRSLSCIIRRAVSFRRFFFVTCLRRVDGLFQ